MPSFRSLFRALNRSASGDAPAEQSQYLSDKPELWRRAPLQAWPFGSELTALQALPEETVHLLPIALADWIQSCTTWKSLDEHLECFREQHFTSPTDLEILTQNLPRILEANLLLSETIAQKRACASPSTPQRKIIVSAIGFPTGGIDGLKLLPRAISSFAENLRTHGRTADLLACDSSLDTGLREQYRNTLHVLARELNRPIRYFGAEEKIRFGTELARVGACSPEVADFALGDPLQTGFAPGANRNMMLLDQAGSIFCSVDHDVLCRTTRAPKSDDSALSFFSECDPFARWTFKDRTDADQTTRWESPDHLALHESMLGRSIHEILSSETKARVDFRRTTDSFLHRIGSGPARVRATFCGHSGEPGVPSAAYYLAYKGANRARLTISESHYRSALASRCLLALSTSPAIGDASLSPGVAFGMDHREILPPFFPVLHAEDFSWSALTWQCCPGSALGLLPWAVAHEPIPGKAFLQIRDLENLPHFVIWEWAHMLRFWTLSWRPPTAANGEDRIRAFARVLGDLAKLSAADFTAEMRRTALATASHQIAFYESQLHSEADELPEFWCTDIKTYLTHLERSITRDGFEVPLDLLQRSQSISAARTLAQQLTARYASVLAAWPDMVHAAAKFKTRGEPTGTLYT